MKKLLLILLFPFAVSAQTYKITSTGATFTINDIAYNLGDVVFNIPSSDTTVAGIITSDMQTPICRLSTISHYKRSTGVAFANRHALLAFRDSFMVSSGGGGSPAGADQTLQYNNAGSFGGAAFRYNANNNSIDADNSLNIYIATNDANCLVLDGANGVYSLGANGNTLNMSNAGVILSSSSVDIDLRPDGFATVWGQRIVTANSDATLASLTINGGSQFLDDMSVTNINASGSIISTPVLSWDSTTITGTVTADTVKSFTATGSNWYEVSGYMGATANTSISNITIAFIDENGTNSPNYLYFTSGANGQNFSSTSTKPYLKIDIKPAAGKVYLIFNQGSGAGFTKAHVKIKVAY